MNERTSRLPRISIIIVNYNGWQYLSPCLQSIRQLSYPRHLYDVIVVDNASTDDSVEYVRANFPEVKVISLSKNYGFCLPNNVGARSSNSDYLIFLNNDTIVSREWLIELVKPILSDPQTKACVGKLLYLDDPRRINVAGGKLAITGGYYVGYGDYDRPSYNTPSYTGFGTGAGVLVERSFFLIVGGFDPAYFASMEEVELGWIIWRAGFRVFYNPKAVMFHKESGTYRKKGVQDYRKLFLLTRNRLLMLIKVIPLENLLEASILTLIFDISKLLLFRDKFLTNALIRAYLDAFTKLRYAFSKRAFLQKFFSRAIDDLKREGVFLGASDVIRGARQFG
jgi:GT2 family glycosyltransferase